MTFNICYARAEDQQAIEDEGIVIPTKVPTPPSRHLSTSIPPNPVYFGANYQPTNPFSSTMSHPLAPANAIPAIAFGNAPVQEHSGVLRKRSAGGPDGSPYDKSIVAEIMSTFPVSLTLSVREN